MQRNQTLTAIRALAALAVFLSHAANIGMAPTVLGSGLGQIGVMLFFALSGFLMTALYADRPFVATDLGDFARARIGRVFPLYLAILAGSVVLTWVTGGIWHYNFSDPGQIALAASFISAPYELWSIPVEVQYYLVFVALWAAMAMFGDRRVRLVLHAVLAAIGLGGMLLLRRAGIDEGYLPYYLLPFVIGSALALCRHDPWLKAVFDGQRGLWLGVLAIALFAINLPQLRADLGLSWGGWLTRTWLDPINIISVTLLLAAAVFEPRSMRFLSIPPLLYLGEISYGFYLFHRPIMELVAKTGLTDIAAGVPALLLTLGLTVGIAALSFHFFEKPALRAIRHNFGPRRDPLQPAQSRV